MAGQGPGATQLARGVEHPYQPGIRSRLRTRASGSGSPSYTPAALLPSLPKHSRPQPPEMKHKECKA